MNLNAIRAGAAYVEMGLKDKTFQEGMDRAQKKVKQFTEGTKNIGADLKKALDDIGNAAALISVPVIGSIKAFADFDDQMRSVQAVTAATGKDFRDLTELAKKLGRETSFTASQVAGGMLSLGRMGFSPSEIQDAIQHVMNLSKATGTELSVAAEIAANNLRVFGLSASDTARMADVMTVTANSSAQTLTDLGEALKMAGPHAARAGATIEDTAAALGVLANMGIRGSLAGTALGKSYKRIADPKVASMLRTYGVETLDATGNLRSMRDVLTDIAKVMKTLSNAEQITLAEEIFDARGSLGGGVLSVNTKGIDELNKKLRESQGAAADTASKMESGVGGAIRNMASAAEGLNLAIGEVLSNSFIPLIRDISSACLALREMLAVAPGVASALAGILKYTIGIGLAAKTISLTVGLFTRLKAVITATIPVAKALWIAVAANPAVAVAIAAVAVAAYTVKKAIDADREAQERRIKVVLEAADAEQKQTDKLKSRIAAEQSQIRRLQELANVEKLNADQMFEAKTIADDLTSTYGDLGIQFDEMNGKILGTADAYKKLTAEQRKNLQEQLRTEQQKNLDAALTLQNSFGKNTALQTLSEGIKVMFTWDYTDKQKIAAALGLTKERGNLDWTEASEVVRDRVEKALVDAQARNSEHVEKLKTLLEYLNRAEVAQRRLQDLEKGGSVEEAETVKQREQKQAQDDIIKLTHLKKEMGDIEDALADKQEAGTKNELAGLNATLEAYQRLAEERKKALTEKVGKYESILADPNKTSQHSAAQTALTAAKAELAEVEKTLRSTEADALLKMHGVILDSEAGYRGWDEQFTREESAQAAQKAQEKAFRDALDEGLLNRAGTMLKEAQSAFSDAFTEYGKKFAQFTGLDSDGGVLLTDKEKTELDDLKKVIRDASERRRRWEEQYNAAASREDVPASVQMTSAIGDYSAKNLDRMLGGSSSYEAKTAAFTGDIRDVISKLYPVVQTISRTKLAYS